MLSSTEVDSFDLDASSSTKVDMNGLWGTFFDRGRLSLGLIALSDQSWLIWAKCILSDRGWHNLDFKVPSSTEVGSC